MKLPSRPAVPTVPSAFGLLCLAAVLIPYAPAPLDAQPDARVVQGTVASEDGRLLAGARVRAIGEVSAVLTGTNGAFSLRLPPGRHTIEIAFIGRRTARIPIEIGSASPPTLHVTLEPSPLPVTGVEVTARPELSPEMRGFHERKDRGAGFFFTGDDIHAMQARALTDVLRRVPGATIHSVIGPAGNGQVIQMGRTIGISGRTICGASYFLNGQPFPVSPEIGINAYVRPQDVEGIEVYSGASRLPAQFNTSTHDARCGVIVIWTRSGVVDQ